MAFRFHRRVTILPGIRLNFGKRGVSVSAGIRGASITAGKRGVYGNLGAPGTGLSYRTRLDKNNAHQRRAQRSQARDSSQARRKGHINLKCDERGKLIMLDEQGSPASASVVRHIWQQHSAQVTEFLQQELERINDDQALLVDIHHDTPPLCTEPPEYEQAPFPTPAPVQPDLPELPPAANLRKKRWWHRIFAGLEKKRTEFNAALTATWQEEHNTATAKREALEAAYAAELAAWQQEKQRHEAEQDEMAAAFQHDLRTDTEFMSAILENELAELDWPRETNIDFEIEGHTLHLDVDLPTTEHFPSQEAKFNKSGKRLLIKQKSATQQRKEYAQHVHGIVFRLIGTALVTLPSIEQVVVAAYTQEIDESTGHEKDAYLISVRVTRSQWAELNLTAPEKINPIAALDVFELQRNMTKTGIFRPITPSE
ncbi:hypothetical protein CWE08_07215 [Aliidiomarina iranensis]|uniref:DUF4236 domain-containing protein n=1 Tax=Aliidiomarina iranensis TaxID=1434071 RepID=A0A432VWK8_9GAMM|nr:DUF4236 domain-containing protein [Aliidiomarina iranensis]RUO20884.1 hypothetical protein CWE08_07215 [Aliidiomarina iranensis]